MEESPYQSLLKIKEIRNPSQETAYPPKINFAWKDLSESEKEWTKTKASEQGLEAVPMKALTYNGKSADFPMVKYMLHNEFTRVIEENPHLRISKDITIDGREAVEESPPIAFLTTEQPGAHFRGNFIFIRNPDASEDMANQTIQMTIEKTNSILSDCQRDTIPNLPIENSSATS